MWDKIKLLFTRKDNMFEYEDTNNPGKVVQLVPPKDTRKKSPYYTVGTNDFNDTILMVYGSDTTITLTMNAVATRHLINMLEASITEEYDDA